jgi:hypothetical protein
MARNMEELSPNYIMDTGKHWMLYIWRIFHGLYLYISIPSRLLQMEKKSNHVSFEDVQSCIFSLRKWLAKVLYWHFVLALNCCLDKII